MVALQFSRVEAGTNVIARPPFEKFFPIGCHLGQNDDMVAPKQVAYLPRKLFLINGKTSNCAPKVIVAAHAHVVRTHFDEGIALRRS